MKITKLLCFSVGMLMFSCTVERTDFNNTLKAKSRGVVVVNQTISSENHTIILQTTGGKFYSGYNEVIIEVLDKNTLQKVDVQSLTFLPIKTRENGYSYSCPHQYYMDFKQDIKAFEGFAIFNTPTKNLLFDSENPVMTIGKSTEKWKIYISYVVGNKTYDLVKEVEVSNLPNTNLNRNLTEFIGNDGEKYTLALIEPQVPGIIENQLKAGLYKYNKPHNGEFEHKITGKPYPKLFSYSVVDRATLELDPRMPDPSMGNHSSPNNVNLTQGEDKYYHGVVNYTMTGFWTLNFIFKDKNGNIIKGTKVPEKLTAGGWGQKSDLYIDINF